MPDERIIETADDRGNTHTTRIVSEEPRGSSWGVLGTFLLLAAIAIVALVIFTRMNDSEVAKDTAVANAANEVGAATDKVGAAAEEAAQDVEDAVTK